MKKFLLLLLVALVVVGMLSPSTAVAQRKNVTFVVNTATVPDTLNASSAVYITGATDKADTVLTNWGLGVPLVNIGGDYWSKTLSLLNNDTLHYKIKVYGGGWEENTNAGNGNRNLVVPPADSTLPLQFWNNGHFASGKNIDLFDKPWSTVNDSFISVFVRVNIQGVADAGSYGWTNADRDSVCILGDGKGGPDLDWGTPFYLTVESAPTNGANPFGIASNTFYSARLRFRKSQVTAGTDVAYKFRLGSNWNYGPLQRSEQLDGNDPRYAGGNRHFKIAGGLKDTTLSWVYFADSAPVVRANPDTCAITFTVDFTKAANTGGFQAGDLVQVQSGFFGTAVVNPKIDTLQQQIGNLYSKTTTIISKTGALLDYQYYIVKNGQTTRENYYNFAYTGATSSEAERRQVLIPSKTFTVNDKDTSFTSARRQPQFPNSRKLARRVRVKFEVDLRPAYYQVLKGDTLAAIQGTPDVRPIDKDSIFTVWGVWANGLAVGGWGNPAGSDWGGDLVRNLDKKMYDDGTHGDRISHDSVYTLTIVDSPDTINLGTRDIVGQVFKFGIHGGDNEGGKGGYGNNHAENVVDTDTSYTVFSQWGSINPNYYNAWDFDLKKPKSATGVVELPGVAMVFALEQNYPNPFNPSTKIEFAIPVTGLVKLTVYNILGQQVTTLVNENLIAGRHAVTFNASTLASGVYLYKITAGKYVSTRKMLLLK